jgi:ABC-type dipeptide/oligopeptide/nickel transport system ATPase component
MQVPILEIKNLKVGFNIGDNYYPAIKDVSLSFDEGKMHAIVGESGCGKTVSAMSILKLLPKNAKVDGGEILFHGENLLNYSEKQIRKIRGRKIALIPQDPMTSLNPLYTIENQLLEVIMLHKDLEKPAALELAKKTLEDVEIRNIENVLKSYPNELSGGMKQRIIIAMALAIDAEVIIADEPTTPLDV